MIYCFAVAAAAAHTATKPRAEENTSTTVVEAAEAAFYPSVPSISTSHSNSNFSIYFICSFVLHDESWIFTLTLESLAFNYGFQIVIYRWDTSSIL